MGAACIGAQIGKALRAEASPHKQEAFHSAAGPPAVTTTHLPGPKPAPAAEGGGKPQRGRDLHGRTLIPALLALLVTPQPSSGADLTALKRKVGGSSPGTHRVVHRLAITVQHCQPCSLSGR